MGGRVHVGLGAKLRLIIQAKFMQAEVHMHVGECVHLVCQVLTNNVECGVSAGLAQLKGLCVVVI